MKLLGEILSFTDKRITKQPVLLKQFAFFTILNYPISFLFLNNSLTTNQIDNFTLRITSILLCIILLTNKHWPEKIQKYFSIIWYCTIGFSIPFLGSVLLIHNSFSLVWLMNSLLGILLLVLLVDWLMSFILISVGIGLGYIATLNSSHDINYKGIFWDDLQFFVYMLANIFIILIFFARDKEKYANLRKLEELKNHNDEIKEYSKKLEKALAVKSEILDNVSHEIRTPLLGFTAISEGLVDNWNNMKDEEKKDAAIDIAKSADRISKFVINILDLSKYNQGKFKLNIKDEDLSEIVEEVIEEVRDNGILNKEIVIVSDVDEDIYCKVDKDRIKQVLWNLIGNAVKYGNKDGEINISLKTNVEDIKGKKKRIIYCTIKDEGVGIEESELEEIFEPFIQGSRTSTKAGGTGLGLSISKSIIEAHGGEIYCKNYNQNGKAGAVFQFSIPRPS